MQIEWFQCWYWYCDDFVYVGYDGLNIEMMVWVFFDELCDFLECLLYMMCEWCEVIDFDDGIECWFVFVFVYVFFMEF